MHKWIAWEWLPHSQHQGLLVRVYILLHTSLSGIFNQAMVEKVGAKDFLDKFKPDKLAEAVQKQIEKAIQSQNG